MYIDGGFLRKNIEEKEEQTKKKNEKATKKKTKRKMIKKKKRKGGEKAKARILLVNPRSTKVARKLRNERENVFYFRFVKGKDFLCISIPEFLIKTNRYY